MKDKCPQGRRNSGSAGGHMELWMGL